MTTCVDERKTDITDVPVTGSLQVAAAASRTDEDVTIRETLFLVSLGGMIFHFLAHVVDTKRSNLIIDKLAAKDILSQVEKLKIKELKKADVKVKNLLLRMKKKSAGQFESFLTTLSETGQQSVADVVLQALHTVRQIGHNPLQYAYGMPAYYYF